MLLFNTMYAGSAFIMQAVSNSLKQRHSEVAHICRDAPPALPLMEASNKPQHFRGFPDEEVSVRFPSKAELSHAELMGHDLEDRDRQQKGPADKAFSLLLPAAAEQRNAKAAGTPSKQGAQQPKKRAGEDVSRVMSAAGVQSHAKAERGPPKQQQQPKGLASQKVSLLMPEEARQSRVKARGKQPKKPAARAALIGEDAGQRVATEQRPEGRGRIQQTALGALKTDIEESTSVAIANGNGRPEITMASGWDRSGAQVLPNLPKAGKAAEQVALQQLKEAEQSSFGQAAAKHGQVATKADDEEAHQTEQGTSWLNALRAAKQQEQAGINSGDGVFEILTHDWGQDVTENTREMKQVR